MITQEKGTADPQTDQEIRALTKKYDDAFNKHDAAALASVFTEDAVQVAPEGLIYGRQAIEKKFADTFRQWNLTNYVGEGRSGKCDRQRCMEDRGVELYCGNPGWSCAS